MEAKSNLRSLHSKIDNFYAASYFETWCTSVRKEWSEFLNRFFTMLTMDLFSDLGETSPVVLDLGCGPSISNIIAASAWSSHIILADFLTSNRKAVESFWRGRSEFNWEPHFRFNAVLELNENPSQIEDRTRDAIKGVYFCDVLNEESIFLVEDDLKEHLRADVVIASLVLDVVALSHKTFLGALRNVSKCLRDGGILLLHGSLGETMYTVGSAAFPVMNIDEMGLRKIIAEAGMDIIKWETVTNITTHYFAALKMK